MASPVEPQPSATSRFGRYEIVSKLATGGMGEVFLARSVGAAGFQKPVVIKKILPHLIQQPQVVSALVNEAKILVMLDHPNIVQVLDLGIEGNDYFMAMEFVQGYPLSAMIGYSAKNKILIPANVCIHIGLEILSGLGYIHGLVASDGQKRNILHRDVSPQNVLISREARVKLTDFGIAKIFHEAEGALTRSLKGKLRYMAPEALDKGRIDQRYDLFAAAIVLFEILCRCHFFTGRSDIELMAQVRDPKFPVIERYHPGIPAGLVKVLERALTKDPEARYPTAADFSRALRESMPEHVLVDAPGELRRIIEDLYNRDDFPLSKSKLPELGPGTNELSSTQPLMLESKLMHEEAARRSTASRASTRRGNLPIVLLTLGLLGISAVVGFLAYHFFLDKGMPRGDQKSPVIVVSERSGGDPPAGPSSTAPLDTGAGPSQEGTRPRHVAAPPSPPRPFLPDEGARIFRRQRAAIARCFDQHTRASDPGFNLQVISTILQSGKVSAVKLEPEAQAQTPLGRCIVEVAMKIRYPRHDKPSVNFLQPVRVTRSGP
jgi:serine/threonine protein kinase